MYSLQVVFALFAIYCICSFKQVSGACTENEQNTEVEKCEKAFVDAVAKDANANCSVEMDKIHNCLTTLSKKCYPTVQGAIIKQLVDITMKQFKSVEFYCSTSNNITAKWSNIAPAVQKKLVCSAQALTNKESYECSKDFRTKLHKAPRDSDAIEKSYQESNECIKKEADKHCSAKGTATGIHTAGIAFQVIVMVWIALLM